MMAQDTYSKTMLAAETLAADDWNVWVTPNEDAVLATKNGVTMKADVDSGRGAEELLTSFINEDMTYARFENIAYACLRDGYTEEEIEDAIDIMWADE